MKRKRTKTIRARTQDLRRSIVALDHIASGMVSSRTKLCGRPNCRCAQDPAARHGPYFEWTRYQDGRLVHRTLTPEQAAIFERAIANRRKVQRLLALWEHETVTEVLNPENR